MVATHYENVKNANVNNNKKNIFLLVHTMTITQCEYEVEAQYYHAFENTRIDLARYVGRRLKLKIHPSLITNNNKANLYRLISPNLKTLMKQNSTKIKHRIRTIPIPSNNGGYTNTAVAPTQPVVTAKVDEVVPVSSPTHYNSNGTVPANVETKIEAENNYTSELLTTNANPQQTVNWLNMNRFNGFQQTFANFAGSDMLRMSRDDLTQICGQADGIRLYNALHAKAIIPKLTIYVSRDSETYHAIYLLSLTNYEILQKLSVLFNIPSEQIKEIFIEGPQSIRVHLTNDVIRHMKQDTLFKLDIIQENNGNYQFLLRNTMKTYKDVNVNKVNNN